MTAQVLHQLGDLVTAVLALDPPDPDPVAPPGLEAFGTKIISWLKWIGVACGVGGLAFCAIQMMVGHRGRHALAADGAAGIPWVIAGLSLLVLAAGIVAGVTGF